MRVVSFVVVGGGQRLCSTSQRPYLRVHLVRIEE